MRVGDPTPPRKAFLKVFLKPEFSSAQPEVKHINPYLGIKINRGLLFKRCGTTRVFHPIPQRL